MKRRDFLRYGSVGIAGLALNGSNLGWLINEARASGEAVGTPWKFGVMADTQWSNRTTDPDNPATCAIDIIAALNGEFIRHGCRFVLQCGDLVDRESWTVPNNTAFAAYVDPFGHALGTTGVRTLKYRAWAASALYEAGIGFYPCRGNHESSATAATEFRGLFPQTQGNGDQVFGATNFQPSSNPRLAGLSYAFDFDNVRIVVIDQFIRPGGYIFNKTAEVSGTNYDYCAMDQVDWVSEVLGDGGRASDMHAFVMSHKNLAGQNHKDYLFGSGYDDNTAVRDQFIGVLSDNKVGYYLGGHDHQHYRSRLANASGASAEQIITSSNSYKFYTPAAPYQLGGLGEKAIADELYTIGYYIFTVDGPCVTVDFYSSSHGQNYGDIDLQFSPAGYDFHLRETFGYSLNGKSFLVNQGASYAGVVDSFEGTTARILAGVNGNTETVYGGAAPVKTVKTGWRSRPGNAASAVLYLWGLRDNLSLYTPAGISLPGADEDDTADVYVLSMSFVPSRVSLRQLRAGGFGIKTQHNGAWVDAVDLNVGGAKRFVYGAYSGHALGSYGVDPNTMTAWAVVNHDGQFVAM